MGTDPWVTFNSVQYGVFLVAVVIVVWRASPRRRNVVLLLASYLFYASWDWRFMALILASTAIGYTSGLALHRSQNARHRKRILITRVVLNLLLLGVFKYFDFFIDTAVGAAQAVGLGWTGPSVRILLPIAISYMTFEEIAYAVDVYRREIEPTSSVVDYGLFVAFFPSSSQGRSCGPRSCCHRSRRTAHRRRRRWCRRACGSSCSGCSRRW
jgi:alginate O-acetyltransferase complex protein AlgI